MAAYIFSINSTDRNRIDGIVNHVSLDGAILALKERLKEKGFTCINIYEDEPDKVWFNGYDLKNYPTGLPKTEGEARQIDWNLYGLRSFYINVRDCEQYKF